MLIESSVVSAWLRSSAGKADAMADGLRAHETLKRFAPDEEAFSAILNTLADAIDRGVPEQWQARQAERA